ncbi:hypothetical protein NBRC116590_18320 [Pelagimonas sp. KU-00592-HH]
MGWLVLAILVGLVVVAAVLWLGRWAYERRADRLAGRIGGDVAGQRPERLPRVVRDFARRNGADPEARVSHVEFGQSVKMRLRRGAPWVTLWGWQWSGVRQPGFLWKAGRELWKDVAHIRVLDGFLNGRGFLEVYLLGALPMVRASGADISKGEAMRYLAELVWVPDAILENGAIRWTVVGERHVAASMGDARVVFEFDAGGDIIGVQAKDRPVRAPKGEPQTREWIGTFERYSWVGGRRMPTKAEVGYVYPDGYEAYWRGEITAYHLRH